MSRVSAGFALAMALWLLPLGDTSYADQDRAGRRRSPPPAPPPASRVVASPKTHIVFIGGYFYDPFYGPYPWWTRGAYPWYAPIYDARAEVRIQASPREAAVYVDGYYAGLVDDFDGVFQRLPLTPGSHELTFYLQGFETMRWRLYLQPAANLTLRHVMARTGPGLVSERPRIAPPIAPPPTGTYTPPRTAPPPTVAMGTLPAPAGFGVLVLHVQPADAAVEIDGEPCISSAPGFVEAHVSAGPHRLTVNRAGHQPFTTQVEVVDGQTTTLNVLLPALPPPTR